MGWDFWMNWKRSRFYLSKGLYGLLFFEIYDLVNFRIGIMRGVCFYLFISLLISNYYGFFVRLSFCWVGYGVLFWFRIVECEVRGAVVRFLLVVCFLIFNNCSGNFWGFLVYRWFCFL